jgi:hypothetical protein
MKRFSVTATMLASALLSSCATTGQGQDGLCRELALFANATPPGGTEIVVLVTSWGPRPAEPPIEKLTISSVRCERFESPQGDRLCAYLSENASTELSFANYDRAMSCTKQKGEPAHTSRGWETPLSSHTMQGVGGLDENVELGIGYVPDKPGGSAKLVFAARRHVR